VHHEILNQTLKTQVFELDFDERIEKVIVHSDIFIVLLDPTDGRGRVRGCVKNNVYGVNSVGEIIWQIQSPENARPDSYGDDEGVFVGIGQLPDGNLTAITYVYVYRLDCNTGNITFLTVHR